MKIVDMGVPGCSRCSGWFKRCQRCFEQILCQSSDWRVLVHAYINFSWKWKDFCPGQMMLFSVDYGSAIFSTSYHCAAIPYIRLWLQSHSNFCTRLWMRQPSSSILAMVHIQWIQWCHSLMLTNAIFSITYLWQFDRPKQSQKPKRTPQDLRSVLRPQRHHSPRHHQKLPWPKHWWPKHLHWWPKHLHWWPKHRPSWPTHRHWWSKHLHLWCHLCSQWSLRQKTECQKAKVLRMASRWSCWVDPALRGVNQAARSVCSLWQMLLHCVIHSLKAAEVSGSLVGCASESVKLSVESEYTLTWSFS